MSIFKKIFKGKKEQSTSESISNSVQNIIKTEELLLKKQEVLEEQIKHEHDVAKQNASSNNRVALQALRKKKRLEKQLDDLLSTMTSLENQRITLENSHINAEVLGTMKDASSALKKANKKMNIEDVSKVIDDIAEVSDQANEITEALATLITNPVDDDDLMSELEDLKQETLNEELLDLPKKLPELPNVPVDDPKTIKNKSKDDDEMKELENWAFS